MPGSRVSSGWTIMSQIEVPITITNVPGSSTPTPGTDTHASTLPTATAVLSDNLSFFATSGVSVPALEPSGTNVSPNFSPGLSKPGYAAVKYSVGGRPSSGDHIALKPAVAVWRHSEPVSHQMIQSVASMNAAHES